MQRLSALFAAAYLPPALERELKAHGEVYLVGGALRDLLLDRPVSDFDFVTPGDPTALARALASEIGGHWFWLDQERQQSRIMLAAQRVEITLDFAPLRAPDLSADLCLRDFTVNALALPMTSRGSFAEALLDPLHGRSDLVAGRLRHCAPVAFRDDPLRLLRAVRLALSHSLTIVAATLELMRDDAALLGTVAPERIAAELGKILANPAAATAWSNLTATNLAPTLFGDAVSTEHLSLLERVEAGLRQLQDVGDGEQLALWLTAPWSGPFTRSAACKLAALIGELSIAPASLTLPASIVALLTGVRRCVIIGLKRPSLRSSARGHLLWAQRQSPEPLALLAFLAARDGDNWPAERTLLAECLALALPGRRLPSLVDGRWVTVHLGIPAGPEVGRILTQLDDAEIAGQVTNLVDARNFLLSNDLIIVDKERPASL